jgi:DNA-binding MarR family transcriptional regulator
MAEKTYSSPRGGGETPALEQRVFVHLVKTETEKMFELASLLRRHGLSEPQYNVLRILRGAGKEGLPCGRISDRMLTRLPDITRLVDRLEGAGYVARARPHEDRRVIVIRITAKGLRLLAGLDEPILQLHGEQFSELTNAELRELERLLIKARTTD